MFLHRKVVSPHAQ